MFTSWRIEEENNRVLPVVPPQKPRNLSCATSDMKTVTCSWDSGRERDQSDLNEQKHTLYIK